MPILRPELPVPAQHVPALVPVTSATSCSKMMNNDVAGPDGSVLSEGLGLSPERSLVVPVTEVRQYSEYGKFAVGDYVTRDGSDVQLVKDLTDDGFCGTFVCVVAPSSGWCAVGEDEFNLCRRYRRVDYRPNAKLSGCPLNATSNHAAGGQSAER